MLALLTSKWEHSTLSHCCKSNENIGIDVRVARKLGVGSRTLARPSVCVEQGGVDIVQTCSLLVADMKNVQHILLSFECMKLELYKMEHVVYVFKPTNARLPFCKRMSA